MDSSFALVYRNLAQAYEQAENDTAKAITAMEKAVQLDRNNARFLYELDMLYEAGTCRRRRALLPLKPTRRWPPNAPMR